MAPCLLAHETLKRWTNERTKLENENEKEEEEAKFSTLKLLSGEVQFSLNSWEMHGKSLGRYRQELDTLKRCFLSKKYVMITLEIEVTHFAYALYNTNMKYLCYLITGERVTVE